MTKDKTFIIAEAGVNHNGKIELAYQLCNAAKDAGADCVKFQTWQTHKIVTAGAEKADYQKINTGAYGVSQFEMLEALELTYTDFEKIRRHCDALEIQFASTPDEEDSLDFLVSLGIPFIKVGSGEVSNIPFLRKIGQKKKSVILSTGMSDLHEVERAYSTLKEAGAPEIALLHCTSNYPCPFEEVNLRSMITLRDVFGCVVGYSDHTLGIEIAVAAVALGAKIIEKHLTLDKCLDGPDHSASLDPVEFRNLVAAIRNVELGLGDSTKRPNPSEIEIARVVRKSIVAGGPIAEGDILSPDNLALKRTGGGIPAEAWDEVVGRRADRPYQPDELIRF